MEIFIEILIELIGQILIELLARFGILGISAALGFKKSQNPAITAFGYIIIASVSGALSVHFFPSYFIKRYELRVGYLVLAPILVGLMMGLPGKLRADKHKEPIRIDSFLFGYIFALTFAAVRFFFIE